MRRVDRRGVEVPASLVPQSPGRKRQSKGASELARNLLAFAEGRPKDMAFTAYSEDSVKAGLHSLFHGKCAYCESFYDATAPVDVEHFRPKGRVAEAEGHPGYWWLAADWDNLLPSCIDCNRRRRQRLAGPDGAPMADSTGKADQFPVDGAHLADHLAEIGAERPLLIDPCRDEPARHLAFRVDPDPLLALVLPLDAAEAPQRGAAAIRVHGLNRLALVQERTRILRRLELLRDVLARLDEAAALIEASGNAAARKALAPIEFAVARLLDDMRAMAAETEPYSAMVTQWLRHWATDLSRDD
ncbi:hypothetical protein [Frigidibacter mobilis]|uniref:HNH nuclease n=1 Tax=Frigidibacter mobilis TaxID=1335048 RepID=A0A159Z2F9_9RHOB|nr:hypothetical protein [Frigidibacter mobilis]AMY68274.1 HNH nuclease [Frigidibacter mobilis]